MKKARNIQGNARREGRGPAVVRCATEVGLYPRQWGDPKGVRKGTSPNWCFRRDTENTVSCQGLWPT